MDWHLKVHMNPLVMDQGLDLDVSKNKAKKDLQMLGCDTKLRDLSKGIVQYFNEDYVSLGKTFFCSIRGQSVHLGIEQCPLCSLISTGSSH